MLGCRVGFGDASSWFDAKGKKGAGDLPGRFIQALLALALFAVGESSADDCRSAGVIVEQAIPQVSS